MEAYTEWTLSSGIKRATTKEVFNFEQFQFKDMEFFKLCSKVIFSMSKRILTNIPFIILNCRAIMLYNKHVNVNVLLSTHFD